MTTTMKFPAAFALLQQGATIYRDSIRYHRYRRHEPVVGRFCFLLEGQPLNRTGMEYYDLVADDWIAEVDGKPAPEPAQVDEGAQLARHLRTQQSRIHRAEQTLRNLGYTDEGGMLWTPPKTENSVKHEGVLTASGVEDHGYAPVDTDVEFTPAGAGEPFAFEIKAGRIAGIRVPPAAQAIDISAPLNEADKARIAELERALDMASAVLESHGFQKKEPGSNLWLKF